MFDIDLMNRPGLQKIITKLNIDPNSQKQKIIFENFDSNEKLADSGIEKNKKNNSQASSFSLIMASIILSVFFLFGFFKLNEDIKFPTIISKYLNYFKSTNTPNVDIGKSLIINFLSNPEKIQLLRSIDLDENLNINIKIDQISDLNLKLEEAKFISIVENKEFYNASFYIPINHLISNHNIDLILNNLLDKYEHNSEVVLGRDSNSIYFISNGKVIYQIIEKLIFTSDINITRDVSGKNFILKYSY